MGQWPRLSPARTCAQVTQVAPTMRAGEPAGEAGEPTGEPVAEQVSGQGSPADRKAAEFLPANPKQQRALSPAYQWHKQHRRADAIGGIPVRAFGPRGEYTLWLISPVVQRSYRIVNGKPSYEAVQAVDDPEIAALREKAIISCRPIIANGAAILEADLVLMEYAIAVIRKTYNVSDDDLTMLLCSGNEWVVPMAIHAAGGEKVIESLRKLCNIDTQFGDFADE